MTGSKRRRSSQHYTLRRRSLYIFAWLSVTLVVSALLIVVIAVPGPLSAQLPLVGSVCVIVWFVWLLGAQRIVVADDGLMVVSWFVRWEIPWSAVVDVKAPGNLVIELVDGRAIEPPLAGDSVISTLTRNVTQRRMRDAILAKRPDSPPPGRPIKRHLYLHLRLRLCYWPYSPASPCW